MTRLGALQTQATITVAAEQSDRDRGLAPGGQDFRPAAVSGGRVRHRPQSAAGVETAR